VTPLEHFETIWDRCALLSSLLSRMSRIGTANWDEETQAHLQMAIQAHKNRDEAR
jgi:hypothetical protein